MKKCELCNNKVARMYCQSDQASLCWDCDSKVHTANFLVGKHTRTLLCHACQSPTPWTGSGPKLAPTVSVCEACVVDGNPGPVNRNTEDEEDDDDDDDDDDQEEEEEEDYDDDDDSENQVVPLSLPPSSASTSSSREDNAIERPEAKNSSPNRTSWTWRF